MRRPHTRSRHESSRPVRGSTSETRATISTRGLRSLAGSYASWQSTTGTREEDPCKHANTTRRVHTTLRQSRRCGPGISSRSRPEPQCSRSRSGRAAPATPGEQPTRNRHRQPRPHDRTTRRARPTPSGSPTSQIRNTQTVRVQLRRRVLHAAAEVCRQLDIQLSIGQRRFARSRALPRARVAHIDDARACPLTPATRRTF
jgi:hypothetical protein